MGYIKKPSVLSNTHQRFLSVLVPFVSSFLEAPGLPRSLRRNLRTSLSIEGSSKSGGVGAGLDLGRGNILTWVETGFSRSLEVQMLLYGL